MRILKILCVVVFVFLFVTGCFIDDDGLSGTVKEEKTLTFEGIDSLRLGNVTGSIEISGWDRDQVEVRYRKKAANESLLKRLRVETRQDGRALDIETEFPRRCRRCGISFKVSVPRSMKKLNLKTVTGSVEIRGMDHVDRVAARTVTGSVKAFLSCGDCDLKSVTGGIRAEFEKIDDNGGISASLTTGSVTLVLPRDFPGTVGLKTVTGSVHTDFPITTTGRLRRNRIEGSIGEGDRRVRASTVTGSIHLKQRPS